MHLDGVTDNNLGGFGLKLSLCQFFECVHFKILLLFLSVLTSMGTKTREALDRSF